MATGMKILGIETSCDETALSIVEATTNSDGPVFKTVASLVRTQIETHAPHGGVFPMLAKREHAANLPQLLDALGEKESDAKSPATISEERWKQIQTILEREEGLYENLRSVISMLPHPNLDMIAVTSGPGLEPALWVGINFARALSLAWDIPMLGVNHMEGHIISVLSDSGHVAFPSIALLISGGHTELVHASQWGSYEILGQTRDDAVGEAFDKVARILSLGYPGGPAISKLAALERERRQSGTASAHTVTLPRPMIASGDLDFSFSGLKTAVLYAVRDFRAANALADDAPLPQSFTEAIAYEFEEAATETLVSKTKTAIEKVSAQSLVVGGGVASNDRIRSALTSLCSDLGITLHLPHRDLATDNAVMIAMAGFLKAQRIVPSIAPEIQADGNWKVTHA
jgi:N6-L-threonylcarbamoyladenine synthase